MEETITLKKVSIGLDSNAVTITYGNEKYCHAKAKNEIDWESDGPFGIQFLTTSPFAESCFQSTPVPNGKHVVKRQLPDNPPTGTHSYACALYFGGKVYVDANCPAIIID